MDDAKYYNAAAIGLKNSYAKLSRSLEKYGSWKSVWENIRNAPDPEKEFARLTSLGIKLLLKESSDYPVLLREIPLPPFGIYVLGNLEHSDPAVGIIGTRAATPHGKATAKTFAITLARAGVPIISGLALGIDAEAHRGTLDASGKTIAVLGTPLDNFYPKQNSLLAREILKNGGAIISEFPLGHTYSPSNFLARNRIVSGLSRGILIVEAPERSGSLATARFAIDQNRDIFVIPGNINSNNYKGSNALIKSGAMLVTQPEDILEYYNLTSAESGGKNETLTDEEQLIINAVKSGPISAEQILNTTDLEISRLNQLLALLTIKGIIKELNGKYSLG